MPLISATNILEPKFRLLAGSWQANVLNLISLFDEPRLKDIVINPSATYPDIVLDADTKFVVVFVGSRLTLLAKGAPANTNPSLESNANECPYFAGSPEVEL